MEEILKTIDLNALYNIRRVFIYMVLLVVEKQAS